MRAVPAFMRALLGSQPPSSGSLWKGGADCGALVAVDLRRSNRAVSRQRWRWQPRSLRRGLFVFTCIRLERSSLRSLLVTTGDCVSLLLDNSSPIATSETQTPPCEPNLKSSIRRLPLDVVRCHSVDSIFNYRASTIDTKWRQTGECLSPDSLTQLIRLRSI